ncbi:hypothetical protein C8R47DRAFT_339220 [Mycena vitilis]|nr:hypothetical protein C8R47DRAFT_339220 [Mycena vitilis]
MAKTQDALLSMSAHIKHILQPSSTQSDTDPSARLSVMADLPADPFEDVSCNSACSSISSVGLTSVHGSGGTSSGSGCAGSLVAGSVSPPAIPPSISGTSSSQSEMSAAPSPTGSTSASSSRSTSNTNTDAIYTLEIVDASALVPDAATSEEGLSYRPVSAPLRKMTIYFKEADIPDPVYLSFKGSSREMLNQIVTLWSDDAGSPWYTPQARTLCTRLPRLKSHPIAIKHWYELYHHTPEVWKKLKSNCSQWKFLYDHWERSPNDTEFWKDFQLSSGKDMSLTQVTNTLREGRVRQDAADCARAHREYDEASFQNHFPRRGSRGVTLSRPTDVAGRYRELLAERAKIEYDAVAFEQQFSYTGRRGLTAMTDPDHIARRYIQLQDLLTALK